MEPLTSSWGNQQHKGPCLLLESHCSSPGLVSGLLLTWCADMPRFRLSEDSRHQLLWSSSEHCVPGLPLSFLAHSCLAWVKQGLQELPDKQCMEMAFFRELTCLKMSFILCLVDILADNAFWARNNSAAEFWVLLPLSFGFQWCRWEVQK